MRRKTYPSSDSGNPSWCRLCGLIQLGTLHIVKICSWRQKNNCTPHARQPRLCAWKIFAESSLPWNESKPCLLWRSWERWLNNFRIFRALITGRRSHFERSNTVKRFTEVSLHRRRAQLCRAWSLRIITHGLVAVYFSPSLLINWVYIRPKGG